jgi:hypothetical protein
MTGRQGDDPRPAAGSHPHRPPPGSPAGAPDLRRIRVRHPDWWIDWTGHGYQARWKHGSYADQHAATEDELSRKLRSALVGRPGPEGPPDELDGIKSRHPRYWIQRVPAGYLAVPRGVSPVLAATIDDLDQRLGVP